MPNKKTISGSKILDGQDILAFRHDVLAGNFIATVELQKGKKAIHAGDT